MSFYFTSSYPRLVIMGKTEFVDACYVPILFGGKKKNLKC